MDNSLPPNSSTPGRPDRSQGSMRQVGQALSLGSEIVFPSLLGWWMDRWFESAPTYLITGGVLGFVLMFVHASRLIESDRPQNKAVDTIPPEDSETTQS